MTTLSRILLLTLSVFAVLSVFFTIPSEEKYRRGVDEGDYYRYACHVSGNGVGGVSDLAQEYLEGGRAMLHPSPIRVGHILATAFWFKIVPATYVSLARFSFLCFVLFLIVSFCFSRKHFGIDVACVFVLLLSSSPLLMGMSRRALSEMHGNLWCGLTIWLFLDFMKEKRRGAYYLFLAAYALSILSRESSLIVWPFLVGVFLVDKFVCRNELPMACLAGIVVIPAVIVGSVYVVMFGGALEAWRMFATLFALHGDYKAQTSQFAWMFCSGPWFRYLIDLIVLSPYTFLLFVGFVGHRIAAREFDWKVVYFAGYYLSGFVVFAVLLHFKDVRFLVNIEMVMVLFAVLYMFTLFRNERVEYRTTWILVTAVAIFLANYINFNDIFCINGVYDPISYELLMVKKIVP